MNYLSKTISDYVRFMCTMALGALTLGYGATSYAQAEVEEVLEEIVVTGSYIPRTSLVTPTPIMTLDSASIEASGLQNMGDLLLELPAVNIGITPTGSQSGTDQGGLYSINLRDLGTDRTLTLIDGRRVASNRPGANLVSTNSIPDAMIERVEVITGGASAVYGSDAIAGVVNFILKDDFEGIRFDTRTGQSQHGGGDRTSLSLTLGSNFVEDRGNVIFNLTYDEATEIRGNERDYYLNDKQIRREDGVIVNEIQDVFSSTSPIARIDIAGAPSDIDRWRVEPGPEGSDRDSRTFDSFSTSEHGYNSQNFQSQFGPYERILAGTKMIFNLTDQHQLFAQAFFVSDKTDSFTNPEGLDQEDANPGESNINPDLAGVSLNYPFLPTQIRQVATDVLFNPDGTLTQDALDFGCAVGDVDCANDLGIISWRKRFFSQGRRTKPNTRDTLRLATGFEGQIWQDWNYNLAYSFGRATQAQVQTPDFARQNFSDSLDVEPDPDNPGSFRCANANARNRSCVPLDLWKGGADLTPEEIRWLTSKALYQAEAETTQILANVTTSDLFDMPGGSVGFAGGYEYREEKARTRTDTLSEQRGITTSALPSGDGQFDVHEVFAEILIPLLDNLNTEFAVRYSDYSTVGGVTSYKAGFDFAPIDAIRFRGMYSRAQRAPNLRESQLAPRETGIGFDDPCDGINGQDIIDGDVTAASCAREHSWFNDNLLDGAGNPVIDPDGNGTDLLEFVFDDDTVSRGFTNPNPNLDEETADTYTFGVVLTLDEWIPGLGMSIDYYNIEVEDVMANSSRQETLDLCFGNTTRNPDCDFITRNGVGQVFRVDAIVRNQDSLKVEGIDFFMDYVFALDGLRIPGDFSLSGNYSHKLDHTITRINQLTGEPIVTVEVGEVGDIENRARFGLSWQNENLNVNWRVLWFGETFPENDVIDDQRAAIAGIAAGDPDFDDFVADGFVAATIDELTVPAQWYHNLNVNYDWDTGRDFAVRLSLGINNLTDNDPAQPLHSRLYSSQARSRCGSECSIYENIGRYYWFGISIQM